MPGTTSNQRTIASYERIARGYAASTAGTPSGVSEAGLRRLAAEAGSDGVVLELGSGPGWDADFVESLGPQVRRTDVTRAFRDLQAERGRYVEMLDAITDPYVDGEHPSYDAVMALCVLLHLERRDVDAVLAKVAGALRPDGVFLVSVREGWGDLWEHGDSGNAYFVTLWQEEAFLARLRGVGLEPVWSAHGLSGDEAWLTVLARVRVTP